jgi:tripartite-type tricarboxylate transporter receptor subunit TctC
MTGARFARRDVLGLGAAGGTRLPLARLSARNFAGRPIRLVVPFVAGGATDVIGRIVAERMGQRLATIVVVENRAGANGNIGAEVVVGAEPDGHTLLFTTAGVLAVNQSLYPALTFSTARDHAGPVRRPHRLRHGALGRVVRVADLRPE